MLRKPKCYRILTDSVTSLRARKDTVVYELLHHDWGAAESDTMETLMKHVAVTLDATGDYPFFTVPELYLEEVQDANHEAMLDLPRVEEPELLLRRSA